MSVAVRNTYSTHFLLTIYHPKIKWATHSPHSFPERTFSSKIACLSIPVIIIIILLLLNPKPCHVFALNFWLIFLSEEKMGKKASMLTYSSSFPAQLIFSGWIDLRSGWQYKTPILSLLQPLLGKTIKGIMFYVAWWTGKRRTKNLSLVFPFVLFISIILSSSKMGKPSCSFLLHDVILCFFCSFFFWWR